MVKFTFQVTQANQQFVLDRSIEFNRLRLTKGIINNVALGNTSGALYLTVNNLTDAIVIGNQDRHYTVKVISPNASQVNYDRTINDWDYEISHETQRTRVINVSVFSETTISFAGGSYLSLEFEFR